MKLHLHDYTVWSDPMQTYSGKTQQWRCCKECNKAQFRTLRWHGLTPLASILAGIRRLPDKLEVMKDTAQVPHNISK